MDDDYQTDPLPVGRARQRHLARQTRRGPMAIRAGEKKRMTSALHGPGSILDWSAEWTRRIPTRLKLVVPLGGIIVTALLATLVFRAQAPPNVWVINTPIGGMSYESAAQRLESAWNTDLEIDLVAGERHWQATPADLGFLLDANKTVEQARSIGLAGIPFGYGVDPVFAFDENAASTFLAALAEKVAIPPTNARYVWQSDALTGVAGVSGQSLDREATLAHLSSIRLDILRTRHFELTTTSPPSLASDPTLYYDDAVNFVSAPFQLVGYDPFLDRSVTWTTSPENLATWIEAGAGSLVTRPDVVRAFVQAINAAVGAQSSSDSAVFVDPQETIEAVNRALRERNDSALVRIRYQSGDYEVEAGDTAYRIARKTGIPYFLIEQENPDRDLNVLSPGDIVHLPSRDVALPLAPVANKRIIVNLETQSLVAYESGQEVFRWLISSGIADAPTSPGIYEILSHDPVAYGSSYTLCGDLGCGQWEMNWFMGIYEVTPGLVNGFHGAVLLPNGAYLGGNNVGAPYTLGCIMARDEQAKLLYDWADEGTIVEIISDDFSPQSDLARRAIGT